MQKCEETPKEEDHDCFPERKVLQDTPFRPLNRETVPDILSQTARKLRHVSFEKHEVRPGMRVALLKGMVICIMVPQLPFPLRLRIPLFTSFCARAKDGFNELLPDAVRMNLGSSSSAAGEPTGTWTKSSMMERGFMTRYHPRLRVS